MARTNRGMNGTKTTREILANDPYPAAYTGPEKRNANATNVAEIIDGSM
jgi:hypothetical protein